MNKYMSYLSLYSLLWKSITYNGESYALVINGICIAFMAVGAMIVPLLIINASGLFASLTDERRSLSWLVKIVSGLALVGLIVTYLGIVGINKRIWLEAALFSLLIVLLIRRYLDQKKAKQLKLFCYKWPDPGVMIVVVMVLLISPIIFFHALAYPVLNWDSLFYNAPIANHLYLHGVFPTTSGVSIGFGTTTGWPPLHFATGAFFYTLLDFNNDVFLRLLSPVSWLLLLWAGFELGREVGGSRLGVLSALVLLLTPAVLFGGYQTTYQSFLGVFVALSILFVVRAEKTKVKRDWLLAGWFIGLSGLCSYNGYYTAAGLILMVLLLRARDIWKNGLSASRYSVMLFVLMLLLAVGLNMPWWIRNITVFNTPVPPFLTISTTLQHYNLQRTAANVGNINRYIKVGNPPTLGGWIDFFLWRRDLFPVASSLTLLGAIGVFFLNRRSWYVLAVAGVFWLTPIVQPAHHDRVVIVYSAALATLSAIPLWWLVKKVSRWQYVLVVALLLVAFATNIIPLLVHGKAYKLHNGYRQDLSESWAWDIRNRDANRVISQIYSWYYPGVKYLNENLEPNRRVAATGMVFPYYIGKGDINRIFFLDSIEAMELRRISEVDEIRRFFKERKVQYIFWHVPSYDKYSYEGFHMKKLLGNEFPKVAPLVYRVD